MVVTDYTSNLSRAIRRAARRLKGTPIVRPMEDRVRALDRLMGMVCPVPEEWKRPPGTNGAKPKSPVRSLDAAIRPANQKTDLDASICRAVRQNRLEGYWARVMVTALEEQSKAPFPLQVLPRFLREYVKAWATSLTCSFDMLAAPMLGVAGAAIGRSGRRLRVKDGWTESSCLWTVTISESSEGKTPALNAVDEFYTDRQAEAVDQWRKAMDAYEENPEGKQKPGPQPQLFLTDTTVEALRYCLVQGPTLYENDELAALCHQMGQYKSGNADKPQWTSFWSHKDCNIGRVGQACYLRKPFVSIVGMLVPGSVHELNYRGHGDDGFVHRMLINRPPLSPLVASPVGVCEDLKREYKQKMACLFDPPKNPLLTVDLNTFMYATAWCNNVHFIEVAGEGAPDWMRAKYKKLWTNLWRVSLVLHELWRVAADPEEKGPDWNPNVVGQETIERAIAVINYYKEHMNRVQELMGADTGDDIDALYSRFRSRGSISTREFIHASSYKRADRVRAVFEAWEKRGYGKATTGKRKDQIVFQFDNTPDRY